MSAVVKHKQELRQEYLALRQSLSTDVWREDSAEITRRLLGLPEMAKVKQVLCYVSSKDNEVNTLEIIKALLERGCQVAVPRILADVRLEWRCITAIGQLSRARFGILEPAGDTCPLFESPESAEICIVPGIAWDLNGQRIGYGIGFFDRFLSVFNGYTIGLAFESQLYSALPHLEHDVPVRCLITEKQTVYTNSKA